MVERGAPGQEASSAAAGMLSPSAEAEKGSPLFALCRASLQRYCQLADELKSETGMDPQYRTEGTCCFSKTSKNGRRCCPPSNGSGAGNSDSGTTPAGSSGVRASVGDPVGDFTSRDHQ